MNAIPCALLKLTGAATRFSEVISLIEHSPLPSSNYPPEDASIPAVKLTRSF